MRARAELTSSLRTCRALGPLVLAALWPVAAAAQIPVTTIVNPGFETGTPGVAVGAPWTQIPGLGPMYLATSGSPGLVAGDPNAAYSGANYLTANRQVGGNPTSQNMGVYQDVDLSPYASTINLGGRQMNLSFAYNDNDPNDTAVVAYTFLDGVGSPIGNTYTFTAGSAGTGNWATTALVGEIPVGASSMRLSLQTAFNNVGTIRNISYDNLSATILPPATPSGLVHGNLIQFDSEGAWTWYSDERAIVDPNNGHTLVNSVGYSPTVSGSFPGNVDVVDFDPQTGRRVRTRLSNQAGGNPQIQNDDHNVGALLVLPDGRYLTMYANHGNNGGLGDEFSRWRRSVNPGDSTAWTTEQLFNWYNAVPGANQTGNPDAANVSYHNLFYLSAENQVYDISRSYGQLSMNGASQNMPNVLRYNMDTNSVQWAGQLVESAAQGYSAYLKYASNGVDRIYFTSTETHPRNYNNSVYSGYIQNGQTFDMLGNVIDANLFDNGTAAGGSGFVPDVTDFTLVQAAEPLGQGHNRLWTVDLNLDAAGDPMALYISRWNPDGSTSDGSTTNPIDHRLHFAHWNSQTQSWETHEVARMGNRLYRGTDMSEQDYTGNAALVPGDPSAIYISTPYDPRDPTGGTFTTSYEIYKGVTADGGSNWSWWAITENSVVDNLRPIVPDAHGEDPTVIWFRGTYTTAHSIDAAVVGIVDRGSEQLGLVNYVDANAGNTIYASGAALTTSTPSTSAGPADNLWHERTSFGNDGNVLASSETGFENAPMLKTTIDGLGDGTYDVFAYFWSDKDEDWRLLAGLENGSLMDFRRYGSQHAEADQFATIETVSANSNDLLLFRAYLGRREIVAGSEINVFIDDWQSLTGGAIRTWYDGVGYALVTDLMQGLAGDFNDDHVVDTADYTVWRDHLGTSFDLAGNGDDDGASLGVVDMADYELWKASFGHVLPGAGGASWQIPEPATAWLISLALLGFSVDRRRWRNALVAVSAWICCASCSPALAVESTSYVTTEPGPNRFALFTTDAAAPLYVDAGDHAGVLRVARQMQADIGRVGGREPQLAIGEIPAGKQVVLIGTLGKSPLIDSLVAAQKLDPLPIAGKWEAFVAEVVDHPLPGVDRALVIAGSDKRGTIYGMYDLSAQIGVSPWYWWADVPVKRHQQLYILPGRHTLGEPKVKFRAIFINDEAPALAGWMQEKFGGHNHAFYDHVFELILRLRGNYLWPAMWGRAIYDDDPESPKLADEYGVVIGTTHHEPMMRAHVEWQRYGKGPWNYASNAATLRQFWAEGIRRMGSNESVVTVGMRGDGDEPMSETANIALLERIVADQRKIIAEVTGRDPADVPQMWALYKEVQEYYHKGMRVPDDVTLLLCDDNWGNIRKLPQLSDRPRRGGYGIYYHFDYVGGPRNYKWLNTNQISRVWEQMHLAYEYGAVQLWIVNVGDIKPMEFPIEFFLDYAWNPDAWPADRLDEYTRLWAAEQFGDQHAAEIADILDKYTRYNSRRKPELLAPETYSLTNYREAETVVDDYNRLLAEAERINDALPGECHDAYFQLVLHPVAACANLNELYLTVAKNRLYARQGRAATNDLAQRAQELFDKDAEISRRYNHDVAGGKWNHMMDQTHIGYTYWQEPPQDVLPTVERIEVPAEAALGVAVEGSDVAWPAVAGELSLPKFNAVDDDRHYIEVFNRGAAKCDFMVTVGAPWLHFELDPASDEVLGKLNKQQRLWVSVDWSKLPAGTQQAPITIRGPGGQQATIIAIADSNAASLGDFQGFVDTGGYVSMEAEDFTNSVADAPIRWLRIPGLGRTRSGMTALPVTSESQTPGSDGPRLEYRVHLSHPGTVTVQAIVAPTLNYHNDPDGRRYAVSFDDQSPQVVNIHAGENLQVWEKWVADNANVTSTEHQLAQPGDHMLKFWLVDPGIVLEKLVIDTGGLEPSYLGPPESTHWPKRAEQEAVTSRLSR